MRRRIAAILAVLLFWSLLPFAGAAFTDEKQIAKEYKAAVKAMAEKKILSGFPDGSFGPKKTLTRAQAAKILCVMLEGEEKANALTKTETGFKDVPESHWAAKFVAYCADKGIVAGVGNGKFDPDGRLTSAAFAKMLLVAIGSDGSAFTGKDWIQNVEAAAKKTFLLFHLDGVNNANIDRQTAAQMAFNADVQAGANADKEKGDPREMPKGVPETVKFFVIGNSFGNDCSLDYLYQMLQDVGVKNVIVGTLYYSGCPYQKHVTFAYENQPVYKYHKNTTGQYVSRTEVTFDEAFADEQWTHVMMLHGWVGHPSYFGPCPWQDILLHYVRQTQPDAYYGYDMTWIVRGDGNLAESDAKAYERCHNSDQMTMYNNLVDTTKTYAETEQRFKFIVPVGTAISNARSSFLDNGVYRDNLGHLNKGIGRYMAAMTVCCKLTGVTPDQIKYLPETLLEYLPEGLSKDTPGILEKLGEVARESVTNALAKPYEITQSRFTTAQ